MVETRAPRPGTFGARERGALLVGLTIDPPRLLRETLRGHRSPGLWKSGVRSRSEVSGGRNPETRDENE